MNAKRFLLFVFNTYYPGGGWNDFVDSFDSYEEARAHLDALGFNENWQIVDLGLSKEV